MSIQMNLDVDTFQKNEVRKLVAEVTYQYEYDVPKYPNAMEGDWEYGITYSDIKTDIYSRSLGMVLYDEDMRLIKKNSKTIIDKMKDIAKKDLSRLKSLEIMHVDLKIGRVDVFDLDNFLAIEL